MVNSADYGTRASRPSQGGLLAKGLTFMSRRSKKGGEEDPPLPLSDMPTRCPSFANGETENNNNNDGTPRNAKNESKNRPFPQSLLRSCRIIITHSWINVLLVFVPVGIALGRGVSGVHGGVIFATNCVAVIPLAGLLAYATESVARQMGDALGALLNVSLGNVVELIILSALTKNQIRIVQASILGSILANLLLILGMGFFLGGMRYREQLYNNTVTQMSACLLSLSVISLVLPTALHVSFRDPRQADRESLRISRGTSVILLLVYVVFLVFQLKSHAYLYASTPRHIVDAEAQPGPAAAWLEHGHSTDSSDSSDSDDSGMSLETVQAKVKRALRVKKAKFEGGSSSRAQQDENPSARNHLKEDHGDDTLLQPTSSASHTLSHMASMETCVVGEGEDSHLTKKKHRHGRRKHRKGKRTRYMDEVLDKTEEEQRLNVRKDENQNKGQGIILTLPNGLQTKPKDPEPASSSSHAGPPSPRKALRSLRGSVINMTPVLFPSSPQWNSETPSRMAHGKLSSQRRTNSLPGRLSDQHRIRNAISQRYSQPPDAGNHGEDIEKGGDDHPRADKDEEEEEDTEEYLSRTTGIVLLLISTALISVCAELLVGSIEEVTKTSTLGEIFIGLIVLPIVGNAAEHITAITVAMKNKMDLAIGVAIGSSIQIALCITPLVVILGWVLDKEMSLYFTLFETVCLFLSTFIANFLVLDGRSNYMEGALLCAVYVIIGVVAFFYPGDEEANVVWGAGEINGGTFI